MPNASTEVMITLREVTAATVRAVTSLRVAPEQENYVASNAVSIAQAYFAQDAWFRAIYADEQLIGFAMLRDGTLLSPENAKPEVSLWRFMISHHYQKLGYGGEALSLLVSHARSRPGVKSFETSYVPGPNGPKDFYLAFGFHHTGEVKPSGEVCLSLALA
jgi:diamine N-acetyltransferase